MTVSSPMSEFARDVHDGLGRSGQKQLPSKYLYDALGSSLFEAITLLDEYGLTRADERLLQTHAGVMLDSLPGPLMVAELGSGNGRKTRYLLQELARRQAVRYYPIDISAAALTRTRFELAPLGAVSIVGLEHSYIDGLRRAATHRSPGEAILVLFLGSSIGNFEPPAADHLLAEVRACLAEGDGLLLGTDLVKDPSQMLLAYDDPVGVTAAFNLNLLARMNRELGGNFVVRDFRHEARWNEPEQRIEMHLVSSRSQAVSIPGAGLSVEFQKGETIWTEACHKYRLDDIPRMASAAGFRCAAQWVDAEWPFAESLLTA